MYMIMLLDDFLPMCFSILLPQLIYLVRYTTYNVLYGLIAIADPENMGIDTQFEHISHCVVEILTKTHFSAMAAPKWRLQ